jgi:tRNA threonylcarbamoyladenosine biosynthesis protein TsaE
MPEHTRHLRLSSPDATCGLAQTLAPGLIAGDVLLLSGTVGAGKTHFARCLIRTLTTPAEEVPSPTYTLVQTYPGPTSEIWHAAPESALHLDFAHGTGAETRHLTLRWSDPRWTTRLADLEARTDA